MMASGKNAKKNRKVVPVVSRNQGLPWMTIAAVAVILLLAGGIFLVVFNQSEKNADVKEALAPYAYSEENKDPSVNISGIDVGASTENATTGQIEYDLYKGAFHIQDGQRVNYDKFPPVGGPHEVSWAACSGIVYPVPVQNEWMVHPLEHGAVWIAYNPTTISDGDLQLLKDKVEGKPFMVMSPYTDLDSPISLQS